jgi:hypothetical protein
LRVQETRGYLGYHCFDIRVKIKYAAVSELVEATKIRKASNDYEGAWNLIQGVLELDPASEAARSVQVQLAMEWVRKAYTFSYNREKNLKIIERRLPSLYRGAASKNATLAADAMAHIGWAIGTGNWPKCIIWMSAGFEGNGFKEYSVLIWDD